MCILIHISSPGINSETIVCFTAVHCTAQLSSLLRFFRPTGSFCLNVFNVKQKSANLSTLLHNFFYLYSHNTVIEAFTVSNPRLLFALQLYTAPLSSLLRFASCRVSDVDSTLLYPSFVHVMSGCGLPVALQNRVKLIPSTTS